jgi:hypothetical protein
MKLQMWVGIMLAASLGGCRTNQTTIFVEQSLNREFAKIACDTYKRDHNTSPCLRAPDQMTTDLETRLASAILQNPSCKHVTVSRGPVGEEQMKDYLAGWSLTFDIGIGDRDIDYSNSAWQLLDHKTKKRFDGSLKNSVDAATQICTVTLR